MIDFSTSPLNYVFESRKRTYLLEDALLLGKARTPSPSLPLPFPLWWKYGSPHQDTIPRIRQGGRRRAAAPAFAKDAPRHESS